MKALTTPRLNDYIPHYPTKRQVVMLLCNRIREAMYGGAAGGGKSDGLLQAALQYVDEPNYNAILFRRTFSDLALPEAIMSRSKEWLLGSDARWNDRDKFWTFPSGSTLTFGYLQHENDKFRYQSAAFQFIGFDELTQFTETQYLYLFSRLRRSEGSTIPLRMRSASNPGGIGHEWVKARFITPPNTAKRIFIPARLEDNPHLDRQAYIESLQELDPVTRERLLNGDWEVTESGGVFKRSWFRVVDTLPPDDPIATEVRFWDLAGTEPSGSNPDPDWTVGLKAVRCKSGMVYITDVIRLRKGSGEVERTIAQAAEADGRRCQVMIEQEPGSSGKAVVDHYQLRVLPQFTVRGFRATGSKLDRARPVAAYAERGHICLLSGGWIPSFLTEVSLFTGDNRLHDDQVDALSGAHYHLVNRRRLLTTSA